MEITEQAFERAKERVQELRQAGYAISARYDRRHARIVVDLDNGVQIAAPVDIIEGLAGASPADLAEIEISPAGLGLHWPRLDADVYLPALMQGVFGSKQWMAGILGAKGGSAKSAAKAEAARRNGAKGGRPRKTG
jgi:hypothetical protein